MLTVILGCAAGLLAGVGVYFRERRLKQALTTALALAGLTVAMVLALSHWQARAAMVEVRRELVQRTFLAPVQGAVGRTARFYMMVLDTNLGPQRRKVPAERTEVVREDGIKPYLETLATTMAADPDYEPGCWLLRMTPSGCDGELRYVIHIGAGTRIEGEELFGTAHGAAAPAGGGLEEERAAEKRETRLKAALAAARREAAAAKADAAEARRATAEEKEAARLKYEAQKARALAEQEAKRKADAEAIAEAERLEAEEIAALEEILAEAEKACGYHQFARASVLCAQLKATEDWPQSEKLRMGVGKIDAIITDYAARQQQARAQAAWLAELSAQRAAQAAAMAKARAQARARAGQGSGAGTPLERALNLVGTNRRRYCRYCGKWFTESRREHEKHCWPYKYRQR